MSIQDFLKKKKMSTEDLKLLNKQKVNRPLSLHGALEVSLQLQEALQHEHHVHKRAFSQEFYSCSPTPPFPINLRPLST